MNVAHIEASQVIPSLGEPAEEKKVYGNSQCEVPTEERNNEKDKEQVKKLHGNEPDLKM